MARYRKAIVAALGAVLTFLYYAQAADLIASPAADWIMVSILTATAVGVYQVPNDG